MNELGLADLLTTWDALGRDPRLVGAIARLFALEPQPATAPPTARADSSPPPVIGPVTPLVGVKPEPVPTSIPSHSGTIVALDDIEDAKTPPTAWLTGKTLPRAQKSPPLAEPEPLFMPERERALLATVAKRMRSEGEVDLQVTIERFARRELPRRLPQRSVPSLRGGLQLLVDQSEWMSPFSQDVARVLPRFWGVAGNLQELWIHDTPPEVSTEADPAPVRWQAPMPGTAIVIVSDLGRAARRRGRRGPRAVWLKFLAEIEGAGFDPIVLVPGSAESYCDYRPGLRRTLLLGWDRSARIVEIGRFLKERR